MPVLEFRLLVVPGVTVDKWSRMWSERRPEVGLRLIPVEAAQAAGQLEQAEADAGLVRLPVDAETFHAIPLYTETTVVIVPRDHLLATADEVTLADLGEEALPEPLDSAQTATSVAQVAAGGGVLVVPQSLARLHHRRDLTYRPVTDAPTSSVGLAWMRDRHTDLVEDMIGIVRGRTANSTRGQSQAQRRRKR